MTARTCSSVQFQYSTDSFVEFSDLMVSLNSGKLCKSEHTWTLVSLHGLIDVHVHRWQTYAAVQWMIWWCVFVLADSLHTLRHFAAFVSCPIEKASSQNNRCSPRDYYGMRAASKKPPKEFWSYLIAHGKLHRAKEKPQILPESPSSLPNLRLARYVNIADLSPYAQAPSFKNHYCSEISKINADLLIHYYLLYLYIYGNCWKWSSW